jgi:chromosome segregation ATPase
MNRKLLVTLLRKDIQELDLITEGFMEMNEYPKAIVSLAKRKTEDIQSYIQQLAELKLEIPVEIPSVQNVLEPPKEELSSEPIIETSTEEEIQDELAASQELTSELIEIEEAPQEEEDLTIEFVVEKAQTEDTVVEDAKEEIHAENKSTQTVPTRNDLLSKSDNSIGSILANKKISDIKQAINIGDRFRFQRELFKGNGEDMNKTLNYINQLATLDEVQSFLQSKYNWTTENETVEDFYQIVRRRFL